MRRRRWVIVAAVALALIPLGSPRAQSKVWVASAGAKLKAAAKATAPTVGDVAVGAELAVLGSEGKWYRVKTGDGREGWIYSGKVSPTAPAPTGGGLFGSVPGSSIQARSADTSRSVRGLSPETAEYAKSAGTPRASQDALDTVLARTVPEADIERFLEQGRIGEYAR
jgi:hypothetical protein